MKKLILIFTLFFIPVPAHALTWKEFWEPFIERPHYYYRPVPMCDRPVYREEYVQGTYWRPGYVRRWTEWISVPCYDEY